MTMAAASFFLLMQAANGETDTTVPELKDLVKGHVPDNWKVTADDERILATTENVQFLSRNSRIDPILFPPETTP